MATEGALTAASMAVEFVADPTNLIAFAGTGFGTLLNQIKAQGGVDVPVTVRTADVAAGAAKARRTAQFELGKSPLEVVWAFRDVRNSVRSERARIQTEWNNSGKTLPLEISLRADMNKVAGQIQRDLNSHVFTIQVQAQVAQQMGFSGAPSNARGASGQMIGGAGWSVAYPPGIEASAIPRTTRINGSAVNWNQQRASTGQWLPMTDDQRGYINQLASRIKTEAAANAQAAKDLLNNAFPKGPAQPSLFNGIEGYRDSRSNLPSRMRYGYGFQPDYQEAKNYFRPGTPFGSRLGASGFSYQNGTSNGFRFPGDEQPLRFSPSSRNNAAQDFRFASGFGFAPSYASQSSFPVAPRGSTLGSSAFSFQSSTPSGFRFPGDALPLRIPERVVPPVPSSDFKFASGFGFAPSYSSSQSPFPAAPRGSTFNDRSGFSFASNRTRGFGFQDNFIPTPGNDSLRRIGYSSLSGSGRFYMPDRGTSNPFGITPKSATQEGIYNTAISDLNSMFSKNIIGGLRSFGQRFGQSWNQNLSRAEGEARRHMFAGLTLSTAFTYPAMALGKAGLQELTGYETSMARSSALTDITPEQIKSVRKEIIGLSKELPQTAKELAEGFYFIASNGNRGADSMKILRVSAEGAAGGLGEVKDIADTTTSVLAAYGLQADRAGHVVDVLTQAVKVGKGEATEYAGAFAKVIPIASQVGISFEEVAASMSIMTRIGLKPNEAGTAFRQLAANLFAPSQEARKAMSQLGTNPQDLRKRIKTEGFAQTLQDLMKASGGNVDILDKLVGNIRALTGLLATAGTQAKSYTNALKEMNEADGARMRSVSIMSQTVEYQWSRLLNSGKSVFLSLGEKILPTLSDRVSKMAAQMPGWLGAMVKGWEQLPPAMKTAATAVAAFLILSGPMLTMVSVTKNLQAALMLLGAGAIGNSKAVLAGLAIGALLMGRNFDASRGSVDAMTNSLSQNQNSIASIISPLNALITLLIAFQAIKMGAGLAAMFGGLRAGAGMAVTEVGKVLATLATLKTSGGLGQMLGSALSMGRPTGAVGPLMSNGAFYSGVAQGSTPFQKAFGVSTQGSHPGVMATAMSGIGPAFGATALSAAALTTAVMLGATAWQEYKNAIAEAEIAQHNMQVAMDGAKKVVGDVGQILSADDPIRVRGERLFDAFQTAGEDPAAIKRVAGSVQKLLSDIKIKPDINELERDILLRKYKRLLDEMQAMSTLTIEVQNSPSNFQRVMGDLSNGVFGGVIGRDQDSQLALDDNGNWNYRNSYMGQITGGLADWWTGYGRTLPPAPAPVAAPVTDTRGAVSAHSPYVQESPDADALDKMLGRKAFNNKSEDQITDALRNWKSLQQLKKLYDNLGGTGADATAARSVVTNQHAEVMASRLKQLQDESDRANPAGTNNSDLEKQQKDADRIRQEKQRALSKEMQTWQSYGGILDGVMGKIREYATRTEVARVENELMKRSMAGITDEARRQALALADIYDKQKAISDLKDVTRDIVGGFQRDLINVGYTNNPLQGRIAGLAGTINYSDNMKELQRQGQSVFAPNSLNNERRIEWYQRRIDQLSSQPIEKLPGVPGMPPPQGVSPAVLRRSAQYGEPVMPSVAQVAAPRAHLMPQSPVEYGAGRDWQRWSNTTGLTRIYTRDLDTLNDANPGWKRDTSIKSTPLRDKLFGRSYKNGKQFAQAYMDAVGDVMPITPDPKGGAAFYGGKRGFDLPSGAMYRLHQLSQGRETPRGVQDLMGLVHEHQHGMNARYHKGNKFSQFEEGVTQIKTVGLMRSLGYSPVGDSGGYGAKVAGVNRLAKMIGWKGINEVYNTPRDKAEAKLESLLMKWQKTSGKNYADFGIKPEQHRTGLMHTKGEKQYQQSQVEMWRDNLNNARRMMKSFPVGSKDYAYWKWSEESSKKLYNEELKKSKSFPAPATVLRRPAQYGPPTKAEIEDAYYKKTGEKRPSQAGLHLPGVKATDYTDSKNQVGPYTNLPEMLKGVLPVAGFESRFSLQTMLQNKDSLEKIQKGFRAVEGVDKIDRELADGLISITDYYLKLWGLAKATDEKLKAGRGRIAQVGDMQNLFSQGRMVGREQDPFAQLEEKLNFSPDKTYTDREKKEQRDALGRVINKRGAWDTQYEDYRADLNFGMGEDMRSMVNGDPRSQERANRFGARRGAEIEFWSNPANQARLDNPATKGQVQAQAKSLLDNTEREYDQRRQTELSADYWQRDREQQTQSQSLELERLNLNRGMSPDAADLRYNLSFQQATLGVKNNANIPEANIPHETAKAINLLNDQFETDELRNYRKSMQDLNDSFLTANDSTGLASDALKTYRSYLKDTKQDVAELLRVQMRNNFTNRFQQLGIADDEGYMDLGDAPELEKERAHNRRTANVFQGLEDSNPALKGMRERFDTGSALVENDIAQNTMNARSREELSNAKQRLTTLQDEARTRYAHSSYAKEKANWDAQDAAIMRVSAATNKQMNEEDRAALSEARNIIGDMLKFNDWQDQFDGFVDGVRTGLVGAFSSSDLSIRGIMGDLFNTLKSQFTDIGANYLANVISGGVFGGQYNKNPNYKKPKRPGADDVEAAKDAVAGILKRNGKVNGRAKVDLPTEAQLPTGEGTEAGTAAQVAGIANVLSGSGLSSITADGLTIYAGTVTVQGGAAPAQGGAAGKQTGGLSNSQHAENFGLQILGAVASR